MAETRPLRIGLVATRFAGTDGVSLEAEKWAVELRAMGHEVAYFAGIVDRPAERSMEVPEAFFGHPDVERIGHAVFRDPVPGRPPEISRLIGDMAAYLHEQLHEFVSRFELDLLLPENALAIPMHLPLGLAITQLAAETGMPVLAHHHDLPWERNRFLVNDVPDILRAAFPPPLPNVRHVCINTLQREHIALRLGRAARVIPNVMDFEHPPQGPDGLPAQLRRELGFGTDELFVLLPVRVVPRKGIEHGIELASRLERPAKLVLSHEVGDEGDGYGDRVREYADLLGVEVVWAADRVAEHNGLDDQGRQLYTLADFYDAADLMAYTSRIEGFGNAFLEGVYHRTPIFVNRYPIYELDIRPKGFRCLEMDSYLTESQVRETNALVEDRDRRRAWADENYAIGLRHFSHRAVRDGLRAELAELFPTQ
jgi:glycosyltransferase involved in cell wall biosynthesis